MYRATGLPEGQQRAELPRHWPASRGLFGIAAAGRGGVWRGLGDIFKELVSRYALSNDGVVCD